MDLVVFRGVWERRLANAIVVELSAENEAWFRGCCRLDWRRFPPCLGVSPAGEKRRGLTGWRDDLDVLCLVGVVWCGKRDGGVPGVSKIRTVFELHFLA